MDAALTVTGARASKSACDSDDVLGELEAWLRETFKF